MRGKLKFVIILRGYLNFEGAVVNGGLTCWTLSGLLMLNFFSGTKGVSLHYQNYCIFRNFSQQSASILKHISCLKEHMT